MSNKNKRLKRIIVLLLCILMVVEPSMNVLATGYDESVLEYHEEVNETNYFDNSEETIAIENEAFENNLDNSELI